jgi:glycosyltransferase involved in cell wall biosynthesis
MFKIIICGMNIEKYIERCIKSIQEQVNSDWEAIIMLDPSTDKSIDLISNINDKKINYNFNRERNYPLKNIYNGIELLEPHDEDVIVIVDADDYLAHENVLDRINTEYKKENILLTYGSYLQTDDSGFTGPNSGYQEGDDFRKAPWKATHLRTYKYKLWKSIPREYLIDVRTNDFFKTTGDMASMLPMCEIAGINRIKYIPDILYMYNIDNPIGEHRILGQEQKYVHDVVRGMSPCANGETL